MEQRSDAQLVADFQAGDGDAFAALLSRWRKPVLNFLLKASGNADDAQELFQETFTSVYRNLHRLKEAGKFTAWLFAIALNHARMRFRSARRMVRDDLADVESEGLKADTAAGGRFAPPVDPEETLGRKEMAAAVRKALSRLESRQREVILLKEYGGLKFQEIAETLDIPLSTVKSRMYIGLENLRHEIRKIIRL